MINNVNVRIMNKTHISAYHDLPMARRSEISLPKKASVGASHTNYMSDLKGQRKLLNVESGMTNGIPESSMHNSDENGSVPKLLKQSKVTKRRGTTKKKALNIKTMISDIRDTYNSNKYLKKML